MNSIETSRLSPTVAEINLTHLRHNVRTIAAQAGDAALLGVVKANAYGHGAPRIAHVLQEEGIHYFAVATVPEAIELREHGITDPILVFAAPLPAHLPAYPRYDLDVTVASSENAEAILALAHKTGPWRVHLKVDTGMGRLGVSLDEAPSLTSRLEKATGVTLAGMWTHFASADLPDDTFTKVQRQRFAPLLHDIGDAYETLHLDNSGALFFSENPFALSKRLLVRTGIALYGVLDFEGFDPSSPLHPVMSLKSHITRIKTAGAGTPISYGGTWRTPRRTRIATVGAGYADGYPRLLSNRAEVMVNGKRYPVAGRVCMDMFMVDLGPDETTASVGDAVTLFGPEGPSPFEVAQWAETITYEICCGITARVPRIYFD